MITFVPSTDKDIEQIQLWTDADVYHRGQNNPSWWLTGNGILSFCLHDEQGPVFYVRVDEGEYARLSVQFAPVDIVPKRRLVRAMLQTLPKIIEIAKSHGNKGIIFGSISPTLIGFMNKFGFKDVGDDNFQLSFGE